MPPITQSGTLASVPVGGTYAFDTATIDGTAVLVGRNKIGFGSSGTYAEVGAGTPLPVQVYGSTAGSVYGLGTFQALGTVQPLAGSVHLATNLAGGTVIAVGSAVHGAAADTRPLLVAAFGSSGTQSAVDDGDSVRLWADLNGRLQVRGTIDSIPSITIGAALPAGNNNIGDVDVASMPTVTVQATNLDIRDLTSASDSVTVVGTVQTHGTSQMLGTVQPLAGSVHVANTISGTVQVHGTIPVGTVAGTVSVLGTVQPLAGSVHPAAFFFGSVQGWAAHDAAVAGAPVLAGAFGSSGTQSAVGDGDSVRLWADLNGRLQIRGTIDSMPAIAIGTISGGTVQVHGTVPVGTVAGTVSILGTIQGLAGSVHLATNLAGGTVVSVGSAVHGAVADTRPHLIGAFGSSGTQVAVDDGDAVRLWADLNGRLQVRGTIDSIPSITIGAALPAGNNNIGDVDVASMPTVTVQATNLDIRDLTSASDSVTVVGTVQTHGTSQALGTVQPLAGSVHVANTISGTVQVHGTVPIGTVAGTVSILGTIQGLAGSVHVANAISGTVQTHGTSQVIGTVRNAAAPLTTTRSRTGIATNTIVQIAGANTARVGFTLYAEVASVLIQYGTTAGTFDYTVQINSGGYFEDPYRYPGSVSAFSTVAGGTVQFTEF